MPNIIGTLLEKDSVLSPVLCFSKKKTYEVIADAAGKKTGLSAPELLKLLNERENLGSTYIANGFVMPHALVPAECRETAVLVLLDRPVNYSTPDNLWADVFLALFIRAESVAKYKDDVAELCREFGDQAKIRQLRTIRNISSHVYNSVIRHFENADGEPGE